MADVRRWVLGLSTIARASREDRREVLATISLRRAETRVTAAAVTAPTSELASATVHLAGTLRFLAKLIAKRVFIPSPFLAESGLDPS